MSSQTCRLTVVGCGDAFGSGGRFQSAYLLDAGGERLLIDCGATTLLALDRLGVDPNSIPRCVISHLHGDHFAGLVWWLLQAMFPGQRSTPLDIWGPPGIEARFITAAEALFPGCTNWPRRFVLTFREMHAGAPVEIGGARVTAFEVDHPSGAPSHGLRIETGGKILAYTGDSQWTQALVDGGRGADLYIMECYSVSGMPPAHTSWESIAANIDRIGARRILLTHMSQEMLGRIGDVTDPRVQAASDGLALDL